MVFAERVANVHRTYISSIGLGKVSMGIDIAHALAGALGMKLSELVRRGRVTTVGSQAAGIRCEIIRYTS